MTAPEDVPVTELKGVGPTRARALAAVGVATVGDLLARFPRRIRVLPAPTSIGELEPGQLTTLVGQVASRHVVRAYGRRAHLRVKLEDDTGAADVVFYNQAFLESSLPIGTRLRVSGTTSGEPPVFVPMRHVADVSDETGTELIIEHAPVAGLRPRDVERLTRLAARDFASRLDDPIPPEICRDRGVLPLGAAITALHAPGDAADYAAADDRVVYNGFLAAALRVECARTEHARQRTPALDLADDRFSGVLDRIPFDLTKGQRAAVADVRRDLSSTLPMRRLVQGDVGSGKTVVAAVAAMAAAACGRQAAVLAPTDALARQLHAVIGAWSRGADWTVELLVGAVSRGDRRRLAERLASGAASITVGTHALVERSVEFADLALVVVDEQHRFGVRQRLELVRKGVPPHLLAMSATPIPRSLAMTAFSDLEHSVIRERPPGRGEIATEVWRTEERGAFDWKSVAARLGDGGRAFVVYPAIDSEDERFPSLLRHGRETVRRAFRGVPVAGLHGRMSDEEKTNALEAFRRGDVQALFATTVIEVGVDVPEATEIVIVGAERFGLAQLHQLRGRVGRGTRAGRCTLLTNSSSEASKERLEAFAASSDGFEIAERDLELRGPGDIMGLRQHGHGALPLGRDDEALLLAAFEDARTMIARGCGLDVAERLEAWTRRRPTRSREFVQAG